MLGQSDTHSLQHYLSNWAETEAQRFLHWASLTVKSDHKNAFFDQTHDHVITVPIYNEPTDWWHRLVSPLRDQSICWIWVFNCPDSLSTDQRATCQQHMQLCIHELHQRVNYPPFYCGKLNQYHSVIVVDRVSDPIPATSGVGQARKIAADLALALHVKSLVKSPWFFSTDADVLLPNQYLTHPNLSPFRQNPDCSALQLGFAHSAQDPIWHEATWCYDQYLRYHYRGLCYARSPYAFTTIGSLLAISMPHYAKVRGFPKRAAAEDFYMLNKLRKIGKVSVLTDPVVTLDGRPSDRVPFGTGPSLRAWQALDRHTIKVSHPQCYDQLRELLSRIYAYLSADSSSRQDAARSVPAAQHQALNDLGWGRWLQAAQVLTHPDPAYRIRAFNDWFDALKTWKFLKRVAQAYPAIAITDAKACFAHEPSPAKALGLAHG